MPEPKKFPLTDNPRSKEVKKIPLIQNDLTEWDRYDTLDGSTVFAKKNEDNIQNNSQSIQQLESDSTD